MTRGWINSRKLPTSGFDIPAISTFTKPKRLNPNEIAPPLFTSTTSWMTTSPFPMTSPYYFSSTTSTTTSIPPEPTRRPPFEVTLRPTRSTRPTLKPKNIFGNPDDSFQNPDFVPEYIDDSSAASDETDYYSYYGEYEGDYATTVEPSLGQGLTPSDLSVQLTPGPKPIKRPGWKFIWNTRWRFLYSYSRVVLCRTWRWIRSMWWESCRKTAFWRLFRCCWKIFYQIHCDHRLAFQMICFKVWLIFNDSCLRNALMKSTLTAGIWIVFWFLMIVQIVAAKAQAGFRLRFTSGSSPHFRSV